MKNINRIWLYNPLHDYESVWWVAVWFVFSSKPEGVPDSVMKNAHDEVYSNRFSTFGLGTIAQACELLPQVLEPLGGVLVEMRNILADAYRSFEESFNGSEMLLVFGKLEPWILRLVHLAHNMDVTPVIPGMKLKTAEAEFDAVEVGEDEGQQAMEQEGGAGGQSVAVDDPFVSTETGGSVLGKRVWAGSSPEVDRALRRGKFVDEQTIES